MPYDCQTCGACCSYSEDWPRFTLETDEDLARLPDALVNDRRSGMRCTGDRCSALAGTVGAAVSCSAYAARPEVCRACSPGDEACGIARAHFNLPVLGG